MYHWMNHEASAADADRYYESLPRTIGTCPFCGEIVQAVDTRAYIYAPDYKAVAHEDCYEKATWADLDEMDEDEREDLEIWLKEFKEI